MWDSWGASLGDAASQLQLTSGGWANPVSLPHTHTPKHQRAVLGIEPRTSRTLSENHATRPNSHVCHSMVFPSMLQFGPLAHGATRKYTKHIFWETCAAHMSWWNLLAQDIVHHSVQHGHTEIEPRASHMLSRCDTTTPCAHEGPASFATRKQNNHHWHH